MNVPIVVRGTAACLPLPAASVDLIVTSPPYFALRSYTDGGEHYAGQLGSEVTPAAYIAALIACTREWVRVLKPSGSIFVNLGDKYAGGGMGGHGGGRLNGKVGQGALSGTYGPAKVAGVRDKSLMLLPERYRIACVDELGLIARAVLVWSKPNGLPESVTDRVRRSHEDWVHLVKQPRYYAAVDEIREGASDSTRRRWGNDLSRRDNGYRRDLVTDRQTANVSGSGQSTMGVNPLGKLPGSVWTIATEPLRVPEYRIVGRPGLAWMMDDDAAWKWCRHHGVYSSAVPRDDSRTELRAAPDHFAAFPSEWPRRLILGWSPSGVCTACGEGRRPVVTSQPVSGWNRRTTSSRTREGSGHGGGSEEVGTFVVRNSATTITGYACACTPYTDHPERAGRTVDGWGAVETDRRALGRVQPSGRDNNADAAERAARRAEIGPVREYHFDRWTPPPTRPAVVLDPFGGTGTVGMVAAALGRTVITLDLSMDYSAMAHWRGRDPAGRAKVRARTGAAAQTGLDLFTGGDE